MGESEKHAKTGAKIGQQLRIRLPNDYVVTDGPGASVQDTSEQQVVLTVSTQRHVDVAFTTAERTLSIDDYPDSPLEERLRRTSITLRRGTTEDDLLARAFGRCRFALPPQRRF
mgnify:CR=1 FL=1